MQKRIWRFSTAFIDKGLLERLTLVKNSEFERISYYRCYKSFRKGCSSISSTLFIGVVIYRQSMRGIYPRNNFSKPVFVTDYPKDIKAFYMRLTMMKNSCCYRLAGSGVGEIIGGSQ